MRISYDEQLADLNNELIRLGALCETAIDTAARALLEGDRGLCQKVISADSRIDEAERDIETRCLRLLLQQQPVASDLRMVSAALKMITDMERIGDQAADIAEIVDFQTIDVEKNGTHAQEMAAATIHMVTDAVDAFVKKDRALAEEVLRSDDKVDALFVTVKNEVAAALAAPGADVESLIDILMVAKYFERIGDHATNIAEWVVFSITGQHKSLHEPHAAMGTALE